MRQKAEKKIREATAALGRSHRYRVDQVRTRTDLIRKVFDKTILDMARLKTIELEEGDTADLSPAEIGNLLHHRGRRYICFSYIDGTFDKIPTEKTEPEKISPELVGVEKEMWDMFEYFCNRREGKSPTRKLFEMIDEYIKNAE